MANKFQPLHCKVPKKFSVGYDNYLIILVLHGTFISHAFLFKIYLTVA